MPKFTTFDEIEKYLQSQLPSVLGSSSGMAIEDYLKDEMYQSVYDYVYSTHDPEYYERRMDNGGLSDKGNMIMATPFINSKGQIQIEFENLTTGADPEDSGKYIVDLIEHGAINNPSDVHWDDPTGMEWASPRRFVSKMNEKIKNDPSSLIAVIKHALEQSGFKVKW